MHSIRNQQSVEVGFPTTGIFNNFLTSSHRQTAMDAVGNQRAEARPHMPPDPFSSLPENIKTHLTNISQPRCEQFSRSARRDEEIVVETTMTRSNKAMRENRRNLSGYGHSAPDTASLLLEVVSTTPASSLLVPTRNGQYRDWSYC